MGRKALWPLGDGDFYVWTPWFWAGLFVVLANVLGAGAVKRLPGRAAGVRGEPGQGTSASGGSASETAEWQPLAGSWQWRAMS